MRPALLAAAALLAALCGGCAAHRPPAPEAGDEAHDPYEPLNRKFYAFNEALDRNVLRPVALGYRDVTTPSVREHVHGVLANLANPAQLANDMLQGSPRKAGDTLMRLLINTTLGVAGVFDVASDLGWRDHDNDFGLTLAVWGVGGEPFLYLPVLGPSDPRDAVGYGANTVLDPLTWVGFPYSSTFGWTRFGVGAVTTRERLLSVTDTVRKTALDPYATFRSLYEQNRAGEVARARKDLPATVPVWFPQPPKPPPQAAPPIADPAPARLAP